MRQQHGVALLIAVLAVALAALLATALIDQGEAGRARLRAQWRAEQSWRLLQGLEAWAADLLRADQLAAPGIDSFDDPWARPLPEIEIPGARIRGRLRELGGCFDLNRLRSADGQADAQVIAAFQRLLRALRLDPNLATQAADWADADGQTLPGGAEDAEYGQFVPPGRAANQPFAHPSELTRLPALDAAGWQRLAPYVCALREAVPMNLNTAAPELWLTLGEDLSEPVARRLARGPGSAYGSREALDLALAREGLPASDPLRTGLGTRYFLAEAEIESDGIDFLYTSLLERKGERVRVLARMRGRW